MPHDWDPATSPRPIVFLHGLGLGLLQYHRLIATLMSDYPNRPVLVPLQPQISQDFFHPDFLNPPSRHQMADSLANLLRDLGWVKLEYDTAAVEAADVGPQEQSEVEKSLVDSPQGVTMLSHSKYVTNSLSLLPVKLTHTAIVVHILMPGC